MQSKKNEIQSWKNYGSHTNILRVMKNYTILLPTRQHPRIMHSDGIHLFYIDLWTTKTINM